MYLSHRHYILLSLAIAASAISVAGYWIVRQRIITKAAEVSVIKQEIQLLDERKKREQDIAALYAKTSEDLTRLSGFVVSREKIVDVIEYIERIGEETSTEFKLSAVSNEESEAEIAKKNPSLLSHFSAHIEASGSWENVVGALILLEHIPYSATLHSVRLANVDREGGGDASANASQKIWRLSLDIRVLTSK